MDPPVRYRERPGVVGARVSQVHPVATAPGTGPLYPFPGVPGI
jgi:hypothetical protein